MPESVHGPGSSTATAGSAPSPRTWRSYAMSISSKRNFAQPAQASKASTNKQHYVVDMLSVCGCAACLASEPAWCPDASHGNVEHCSIASHGSWRKREQHKATIQRWNVQLRWCNADSTVAARGCPERPCSAINYARHLAGQR